MNNKKNSYKVNDLEEIIKLFIEKIDDNGRYRSFDYCYKFFNDNYKNEKKRDLMTLYFYAYMASWGMLRNSFLLYKDYLFNRPVIDVLCKAKMELESGKHIDVLELKEAIIKAYMYDENNKPRTYYKEEKEYEVKPKQQDTLVSKAILGTLGIIPAYDRFFKISAKNLGITQKLNKKSIKQLKKFVEDNEEELKKIRDKYKREYTLMKFVDMYFWQKAYNLSPIFRILDEIKDNKTSNKKKQEKIINIINSIKNTKWKDILSVNIEPWNLDKLKEECDRIVKDYYNDAIEKCENE